MITRIKGKDIINFYSVKANKTTRVGSDNEMETIYTARPELVKEPKVEWKEICNFEGDMNYSESYGYFTFNNKKIHISEDEEVCVEKTIFRADLNEKHAFTDKVLCELDDPESKFDAEMLFNEELADFNEAMINSNNAMLAYCKLHKLFVRDTDCIELFKLVYPGETYQIIDGAMKKYDPVYMQTIKANYMDYSSATTISGTISALESKITCINGDTITVEA